MDTNRISDELYFLRVCRRAGLIGGGATSAALKALRMHGQLGGATAVAAAKHPNHDAIIDERGAITFATLDLRVERAGQLPGRARRHRRDRRRPARAQPPRPDRVAVRVREARRPDHPAEHRLRRPADPRRRRARGRADADLRRRVRAAAGRLAAAARSDPRLAGGRGVRRRPDRQRRHRIAAEARRALPDRDPHERHDGQAEGRAAPGEPDAGRPGRPAVEGPVPLARDDRDRDARLPLARLRAHGPGDPARLDDRAAAPLRSRRRRSRTSSARRRPP